MLKLTRLCLSCLQAAYVPIDEGLDRRTARTSRARRGLGGTGGDLSKKGPRRWTTFFRPMGNPRLVMVDGLKADCAGHMKRSWFAPAVMLGMSPGTIRCG